jgi:hypothetical protein
MRKVIQLDKEEKPLNNHISFVPHLEENNKLNDKINDQDKSDSVTTNLNETGNQFAYETVNNENDGENNKNSVSHRTTEFNFNVKSHQGSTTEGLQSTSTSEIITAETETKKNDESTIKFVEEGTTPSTIKHNKHEKNNSSSSNNNDFEVQRFILEDQDNKRNNITVKKTWGKWKPWTSCSRSCGEGVMFQSRECTKKV